MHRKLLTVGVAALSICAAASTPSAFAAEGESRFPTNNRGDLMITKIMPHESKLELTLNRTEANTYYPVYVYFWNGELSDEAMEEVPGMGDEFDNLKVLYNGLVNMLAGDEMVEDGQTTTIGKSNFWGNYDILDFEDARFGYYILYGNSTLGLELDRPTYRGWIDYSRCVNSLAFKRGEATQCWMEDLGDGTVQYQPYDEFGNRYEVVFEEDSVSGAEGAVDSGENRGSDGSSGINGSDGIDERSETSKSGESDESSESSESSEGGESGNAYKSEIVIRSVPEIREKIVYLTEYRDRDVVRNDNTSRSVMSWFGGMAANSLGTSERTEESGLNNPEHAGEASKNEDNKKASDGSDKSDGHGSAMSGQKEEIEVPNLGGEMEKKSDWQMYAMIILIMAAALAGLWFIFFGKKSKREKEGEE